MLQAAATFRVAAAALSQPSPERLAAAQVALGHAAGAFAASGATGNAALETQLAAALRPTSGAGPRFDVTVLSADLDGDGKRELLVSAHQAGLQPLLVPDGREPPQPLPSQDAPPPSLLTTIDRLYAFPDGRGGVVLTRVSQGASATNTEILVMSWDGSRPAVVFDQRISDWAGPARWDVTADGQIQVTCPAFGVYDHKLLPHPLQVRRFRWDASQPAGGAFALSYRHTDPPSSPRQLVNLAEADFLAGDWARAGARYQATAHGPPLPADPDDKVDWPDVARLRLGEIAVLSDRPGEALMWLAPAAQAQAPLGQVAGAFLDGARRGGAVAGFGALQRSALPVLFDQGAMGNLDFPITLGPFAALGEAVAYDLDRSPDAPHQSPDQLRAGLAASGLTTGDVAVGDLDGDGVPELAMILPLGKREQTLWIFVQQGAHWRPLATVEAPNGLDGLQSLGNGRQAIRVRNSSAASAPFSLVGWDGRQVGLISPDGQRFTAIPTSYVPADGCTVAEDLSPAS